MAQNSVSLPEVDGSGSQSHLVSYRNVAALTSAAFDCLYLSVSLSLFLPSVLFFA